jgi:acetylornithine deacetylase/succinyl-diaminopimelate desuccinylase-like protein
VRYLLAHRKELLDAEIALNEGGNLLLSPDLGEVRSAAIGVAEKTFQSYRLTVQGHGGHSSMPPTDGDPVTTLSRALVRLGEHRFPMHVLPHVKDSLADAALHEKEPTASALARIARTAPRVAPQDSEILGKDRAYNALLRTTCVATMLKAAAQDNVLPTQVEAIVNCRILPCETREGTAKALADVIRDPSVTIAPYDDAGFGPTEELTGDVPAAIRHAAAKVFPHARVVGSLGTGATDSRHLRAAGIHAFGISTSPTTLDDVRNGLVAHGPNERRAVKWIEPGTEYLREIVDELVR